MESHPIDQRLASVGWMSIAEPEGEYKEHMDAFSRPRPITSIYKYTIIHDTAVRTAKTAMREEKEIKYLQDP